MIADRPRCLLAVGRKRQASAEASRAVAHVRLKSASPHAPSENAPRLPSGGVDAHGCDNAASAGILLTSGADTNDSRPRPFPITNNAEALDAACCRPLERDPIEDEIGSSALLGCAYRNTGRCCRCRERETRQTDHGKDELAFQHPQSNTPLPARTVTAAPPISRSGSSFRWRCDTGRAK